MKNRIRKLISNMSPEMKKDIENIPFVVLFVSIWICSFKLTYRIILTSSLFKGMELVRFLFAFVMGYVSVIIFALIIFICEEIYDKIIK